MLKARIAKLNEQLRLRTRELTVGWLGSGRLERTFLLIVRACHTGVPRVARIAGTLTQNQPGGQDMVLYSMDLVRVMSGKRRGLAAVPESLRDDETFSPAGMYREVSAEQGRGFGYRSRRELELLSNLEDLASRPIVEADRLPEPRIKKIAFKPETFVPRFTGETYKIVRETPGYEDFESMLENFNALVRSIATPRPDGSYELSFNVAARGGITELDVQTDRSWLIPHGKLDVKSDLFEVRAEKTIKRKDGPHGTVEIERGAEGAGAAGERLCAGA